MVNETWELKDVMAYTGLSRRKAIKLLNMETCPTLPREKGFMYFVPSGAFKDWYDNARWQ